MQDLLHTVVEDSTRPAKGRLVHKPMKRTQSTLKRVQKRIKAKKLKKRFTSIMKADRIFSDKIRTRDKHCLFPGCEVSDRAMLQNSHYFGRAIKSTRFDPDNCIALCWLHHFKDKMLGYEYQKQRKEVHGWDGQYTLFMRTWLGEERFTALVERSQQQISQRKAIDAFMETIQKETPKSL
jgi:hypothetical protein